jgi:L-ascorbate metabolism protein UlaG (beta-lactamase superfamily)
VGKGVEGDACATRADVDFEVMGRIEAAPTIPRHFDGRRFYNPGAVPPHGFADALRWKLSSRPDPSPRFVADVEPTRPPTQVDGNELRATMVNHATVLLQHDGWNMLTDPIWSPRASPVSWAGPHRRRAPGVRIEDLPRIDVVIISHNHYDHLDLPTLRWLIPQRSPTFVVPIGVGRLLRSMGAAVVHELDWGQGCTVGRAKISGVSAVHFSARGLRDRNRTLWCGYVIDSGAGAIYFAGDTAFGPHFEHVRTRFGAPRLALLPIGAYEPRWFMSAVHMGPEQGLAAHAILRSTTTIAIHHGTFQLADDAIDKPRELLLARRLPPSFLLLRNGESAACRPKTSD